MTNLVFVSRMTAAIAFLLAAAHPSAAQSGSSQGGFGIGVKGGYLVSKYFADDIATGRHDGQQVGVFFGGNRNGTLGVMAEVNYGTKGTKVLGGAFETNFVSVPVMLRINVGSKNVNRVAVYAIGGPQIEWLFKQTLGDLDIERDTEGFEASAVVGAGIEVTRVIVEARYIQGFRSIGKTFDLANSSDLKSKAVALLVGFRFN